MNLRGVPILLHESGEGVSDGIRRTGDFYEAEILDYLRDHHPAQRVIVDAGANVGNHTLYFATFLEHTAIHAFEPVPDNYGLLLANTIALPSVTAWPVALSDCKGVVRMRMNRGNMGACLVAADGEIEVPTITLDSLELADVTLLKVDVEDHEDNVLRGAARTIERWAPRILIEDWSHGGRPMPGYELEQAWPEAFTYLYRRSGG